MRLSTAASKSLLAAVLCAPYANSALHSSLRNVSHVMTGSGNIFAAIPAQLPDELVEVILAGSHVRIERIVSAGHASPPGFWYDQDAAEWVILLQGAARLEFLDRSVEMRPGDYVYIGAHERHRVDWTAADTPTVWLAVHMIA